MTDIFVRNQVTQYFISKLVVPVDKKNSWQIITTPKNVTVLINNLPGLSRTPGSLISDLN